MALIRKKSRPTLSGRKRVPAVCCAAARGSTAAGTAGLRFVAGTIRLFAAATMVSGLPVVTEHSSVSLSALFAGHQQTGSHATGEHGGRAGDDRRGFSWRIKVGLNQKTGLTEMQWSAMCLM